MANLKQESINQFKGFGNDNDLVQGEYYRASGFYKSKNGITAGGVVSHLMNFSSITDQGNDTSVSLCYAKSFAISGQSPNNYLFSSAQSGAFIQSYNGDLSGTNAEYVHRAMSANHAYFNHLITDPKGRVLYHQDRYLGMFDGTGSTTNYVTGTVTVTNGSTAVTGSGTTFTAGMVGKAFRVAGDTKFYTVASYVSATSITINTYTGTTGSGKSYIINTQWNDQWKDFGATVTLPNGDVPKCPSDIYEDLVIFGRGNVIVTLNVTTDTMTSDSAPSMSFPAGYSIDHIVSNSNGILIGGNVRSKGFLALWDGSSDRAIAPWIWFSDSILSVCKNGSNWIVTTTRGIYETNGYSTTTITTKFLESSFRAVITNSPKNTLVIDNALHFFAIAGRGRKRAVLYRMNLTSKLVEAFHRYTGNQYSPTLSQMEYVADTNRIFLSCNGNLTENGIDYLQIQSAPTCSSYITAHIGTGANQKVATRVKIRIKKNTYSSSSASNTFSFKVALKIADTKHTLYNFALAKIASLATNQITINATVFPQGRVGDEVEVVGESGNDTNAGYCRNITSISGAGTSTEVWTLDSDFPSLMPLNQNLTITPFQLVKRKTISVTDGDIDEIIFDVKNKIKSNKFMMKVDIEDNTSGILLEMEEPIFIYEDKGVL